MVARTNRHPSTAQPNANAIRFTPKTIPAVSSGITLPRTIPTPVAPPMITPLGRMNAATANPSSMFPARIAEQASAIFLKRFVE